jgi:transposase-like protein
MPAPDRETLARLYEVERQTTRQIGKTYGVSKTQVRRWMLAMEIPLRPKGKGLANRGTPAPTAEDLRDMVHRLHLSYRAIGDRYGVGPHSVMMWLRKHGIPRPSVWETRRKGAAPPIPEGDALRLIYESGVSAEELAREYGVSPQPIYARLAAAGVTLRPGGFQNGKRWPCKDGHRVRSSFEQRVDDWLHEHHVPHTPEPRIPGARGNLRADFLANGHYVEVWGVHSRPDYAERKERKRRHYAEAGVSLIELNPCDFAASGRGRWKRKLARCLQREAAA